jgi:hypothetical protein
MEWLLGVGRHVSLARQGSMDRKSGGISGWTLVLDSVHLDECLSGLEVDSATRSGL